MQKLQTSTRRSLRPKIVPPAVREQIYAAHLRGWTLATICKRLAVDELYARALIKRMAAKRTMTQFDKATRLEIATAYVSGVRPSTLAKRYDVKETYIRHCAVRLGMRKTDRHGA